MFPFKLVLNDQAISLLDAHPRETKTYVHTKTCMQMFIAALLRVALRFKRPTWPSVGEWINKLWPIYTTEYYSAIKRNESLICTIVWMNCKNILNEKKSDSKGYSQYDSIYM